MDPREIAQMKAQTSARLSSQVAAAPPGPPVSPFKGISAFAGAPAVIPSAVTPSVDALTDPVETSPSAGLAAPSEPATTFSTPEPTAAESITPAAPTAKPTPAPATPALSTLSERRAPVPAFAAAQSEPAPISQPTESVKGNAAFSARAVTAEESIALARGDASSIPKGPSLFGEDGMTVADFFSVINPLQHLPLVGSLYREITGDTIKPGARMLGGMLFGGPMGLVGGAFNAAVENDIGADPAGALLALARGREIGQPSPAALAAAPRPAATPVPLADGSAPQAAAAMTSVAEAPLNPPVSLATPRIVTPPRQALAATPAEARILPSAPPTAAALSPAAASAPMASAAAAEAAKPATIPVSFAPAAPAADAKAGFPVSTAGKEFAVPARMNNVQPRQPVPVVRADLSRAKELAPMAPLTARAEAPRPDRSASPASLLTPGLNVGQSSSGLPSITVPSTGVSPVGVAPLGVPGLPSSALPDAMTRALDKYDALLKSRKGGVLNQQS